MVLLDGPALHVQCDGEARRLFPLGRLSRVIAGGPLQWSHEALAACLDHGISITFLSARGHACGYGLPAADLATRENQRIEEFLSREDWAVRYGDWRAAYERREILHAQQLLRLRLGDLRPEQARRQIEACMGGSAVQPIKSLMDGMLASRLAQQAARLGLASAVLANRRPGFHLLRDGAEVLGWRLYADLRTLLDSAPALLRRGPDRHCREVVRAAYEKRAEREDRRVSRFLDSFRFFLGGLE